MQQNLESGITIDMDSIIRIYEPELYPDERMKMKWALREKDEFFEPNDNSGRVLIREASNILENITKEFTSNCGDHKNDS